MSSIATENFNITPPYRNSTGLAGQANIVLSTAPTAVNLSDYFGNIDSGHIFTVQADGQKLYVAIGSNSIGTINQDAQGAGQQVCFPIADGQQMPFRIQGGREQGTGYATLVSYASGAILWAKVGATGATGFMRIYRSSLGDSQDISEFKPTGY